jgi:hypothetical protein
MTTNAQDAPTFRTEADLIAFLDSLHATTETGAATSEKWEPAQRAIRTLRAGGEAVDIDAFAQALGNALFDNSVTRPRPRTHHELREWLRDYFDRADTLDAGDDELCGCGRPAEYATNDGGRCCNKYGVRCTAAPAGDAAALQSSGREGMVLVPREPTDDMIRAGLGEIQQQAKYGNFACSTVYRAMLAAAQEKNRD